MQARKIDYYIIITIVMIPFIFHWLGLHELFSSPLSISIISVLLTFGLLGRFDRSIKANDFIALAIMIMALIITVLQNQAIGCVFACYNIFIMLLWFNNVRFEKRQIQRIHLLITVLLVLFLLSLNIKPNYNSILVYLSNGEEINPNTLGVLVLALFYHSFIYIDNTSYKIRPLLLIAITFIAIYYIELSGCRSAYLSIAIFLVLYLYKRFPMHNYNKFLVGATLLAICFPFIYLYFTDALQNITLAGKSLLSRETVWESALSLIEKYPILGSGTTYQMKASGNFLYTDSAHNVFLGLWKTVGIIPTVLFALYIGKGRNISDITLSNIISKKMFLSCLMLCTFETLLNDNDTYIFFMTLLLTANDYGKPNEEMEILNERLYQKRYV